MEAKNSERACSMHSAQEDKTENMRTDRRSRRKEEGLIGIQSKT